jgi:phospholipid/cholesterol/gamma-HCH transport system substrate-binding protein
METKARYILVGACTLLALALLFALVRFSRNGQPDGKDLRQYSIYFRGGVTGLSVGSNVLFNGVRVGSVNDIRLSETDQSAVRVIIEISSTAIMREDCQATLQTQGITGLSSIYITGGSSASSPLSPPEGSEVPVIPAARSSLERFALEAPEALTALVELTHKFTQILSPENTENLRLTLKNLAAASGNLAEYSGRLGEILENIHTAGIKINTVLDDANTLLKGDFQGALLSAEQTFKRMDKMLVRVESDVKKISSAGMDELLRIFADARQLIQNLDTLARSIQNNPSSLFFGGSNLPEYRPR